MPRARLLILLSGSGRTFLNLHDRSLAGTLPAEVAAVVASRPCGGLEHAQRRGLPTHLIPRTLHETELLDLVRQHRADLVILAGYLRKLPVPAGLRGRILNIHPGLLPGDGSPGPFGGRGLHGHHVHEAVLEAFRRGEVVDSGCTVHVVTAEYDAGPVLALARCPVEPGDTPDTLAARVFALELETYPAAIARYLAEGLPHAPPQPNAPTTATPAPAHPTTPPNRTPA